jgi:hypothetical protein
VIIINKQILIPVFSLVLAGGVILAVPYSLAATNTDMKANLVQKIAQKFGLKEADVQSVVDEARRENHEKRQAEMLTKLEERLTTAVKDGKITDAQKQLILNKHKELQAQRDKDLSAWQSLTPEQRKAKMEERQAELTAWAKANNIDSQYVFGFGGKGMGMGGGMGRKMHR